MLMALALAVLVVACANVGILLVSRAPARARDIAMRLAIGAGRPQVVRQLMIEGVLMAVGGAAIGPGARLCRDRRPSSASSSPPTFR